MTVSTWCIRNPLPAVMFFVLLTFLGGSGFVAMKVQNFPDLDLPTVLVNADWPGASPAQLETEAVRRMENALANLQGLKHISTAIREGNATLRVEFRLEKPAQEAVEDVRSAIAKVRADLPEDMREPVVGKLDLAGTPILAYTVGSRRLDDVALSWFIDDALNKRLLRINGVGAVRRVGGVDRRVLVELDAVKLQALGVSAADISRQLRQMQRDSSGGRTDLGGGEQSVRTLGAAATAAELRRMQIGLTDGRNLRLESVAAVSDAYAEPRSLALLDGKPVIGFEVSRSRGASEVEVGAAVRKALAELVAEQPDLQLTEAFDFVTPVEEEFSGSMSLLYEGALLAVVVVWLFLRDWRATLIVALALPLSVAPSFAGMQYFGFSLNVVTLLALSLVVGILVDDAIVEVENIVRHLRMGKSAFTAALDAAEEIGLAVVATTFTLIAVFLPTAFMSGIPGRFFKQFGWTAALAVFASLLVARMLTPMMAAYFLKDEPEGQGGEGWLMRRYLRLAAFCLRRRGLTLAMALLFFFGTLALVPLLPTGFIPADDNPQTQIFVELPPGATLARTREAAEQARALARQVDYVRTVYTTIGGGSAGADPMAGGGGAEVRKAVLTLTLAARGDRPVRKQAIERALRDKLTALPGARTKVGLGASGEKYMLVLRSDNAQALQQAALRVERDLRALPGIGGVQSSAALARPEIVVRPDYARAADLGVSSAAIAETLRIATVGDYEWVLPKLNLEQRQTPVEVRLQSGGRRDLSVLQRLSVPANNAGGGPVLLAQVADVSLSSGPVVIDRYDRSRNVTFEVELAESPLGEVAKAAAVMPSIRELPADVTVANLGDAEMMAELFSSFGLAMLTGVLCIFMVLVLLFKDFLQPVTILAALPLSFGGGFIALLLAGKALSMPSMIGLVMLMGIATKNSILLVEYAITAWREQGLTRGEALLDACRKRARPVVMTTIAMGAGMAPVALGLGNADSSFRAPMAIAVIGGLVTSTVLSLLVIPAAFTYVDDFGRWLGGLRRRGG